MLGQIKQFWIESRFAYGDRNITKDMKDVAETCGLDRVHWIMKAAGIRTQRGYKRHPGFKGGKASHVAPNILEWQLEVDEPNKVWVTDFTDVRTHEGWPYLTIVLDLFSHQIIGWSMKSSPRADLVIDALLMAIWRCKPKGCVLIHSDQGIQYTCGDWTKFAKDKNVDISMSRRGNCHDNAVVESFFSLLKTEQIKRKIYKTRNEARTEIFNYIAFY